MSVNNIRESLTATIALGATTSGALTLEGSLTPVGVLTPAALTGTALTFQGSDDDVTYRAVTKVDGSALSVTVAASKAVGFDAATVSALTPWRYIKLVSGSTEVAERSLTVVVRPVQPV